MCLKLSDVESAISTAVRPVQEDIKEVKKTVDKMVGLQLKHVELEGQVLHLQETLKVGKGEHDEIFDRLRGVESLQSTITTFDRAIISNTNRLDEQDRLIKQRSFTILLAFLGMGLSIVGGLIVTTFGALLGLFLWLLRGGFPV